MPWAVKVHGKASGLEFILDSRHADEAAAEKQLQFVKTGNPSSVFTTLSTVEVPE